MHYAGRLNIKKEGEETMGKYYNEDALERKHRDKDFINTTEYWEMNDWANKFSITVDELRDIISKVGNYVPDVEAEVQNRKDI